jgi:hypothetical protein
MLAAVLHWLTSTAPPVVSAMLFPPLLIWVWGLALERLASGLTALVGSMLVVRAILGIPRRGAGGRGAS